MANKTQQNLSEIFNIDPAPEIECNFSKSSNAVVDTEGETVGELVPVDQYEQEDAQIKDDVSHDYAEVRNNLKSLLGDSGDILQLAMDVAQNAQDSRSIDAVTKLIGQIADINIKLMGIHASKQDVVIKTRPKVNTKFSDALNGDPAIIGNITNNTMFVGSVTDLLKQIEQTQRKNDDIVIDAERK